MIENLDELISENTSSTNKKIKNDRDDQLQKEMIISKYESDLELLKRGRIGICEQMSHSGIDNNVINKKLKKLDKSIETLQKLIEEFKQAD